MGFLDQLSKSITQGVDRARFEAEKFQRTTRIQGEITDLKRQINEQLIEIGQRAYELNRAGQIPSQTITDMAQTIDRLKSGVVVKEEELRAAKAEIFVEEPEMPSSTPDQSPPSPMPTSPPPAAPTSPETTSSPAAPPASTSTKVCPYCSFQMPITAMFCPNCGARVAS